MAPAAAKAEAAASVAVPRAYMPMRADDVRGLLLGLPPDAPAEDIEYVLSDVQRTLNRLESKRSSLQDQIAAASRGKRRAPRRAPPPPPVAPAVGGVPVPAAADDDPGARYTYTREGAGAVRRRLRAAAGDVKKERKRLEAVWGDLEEALVDATEQERLALQPRERAA